MNVNILPFALRAILRRAASVLYTLPSLAVVRRLRRGLTRSGERFLPRLIASELARYFVRLAVYSFPHSIIYLTIRRASPPLAPKRGQRSLTPPAVSVRARLRRGRFRPASDAIPTTVVNLEPSAISGARLPRPSLLRLERGVAMPLASDAFLTSHAAPAMQSSCQARARLSNTRKVSRNSATSLPFSTYPPKMSTFYPRPTSRHRSAFDFSPLHTRHAEPLP